MIAPRKAERTSSLALTETDWREMRGYALRASQFLRCGRSHQRPLIKMTESLAFNPLPIASTRISWMPGHHGSYRRLVLCQTLDFGWPGKGVRHQKPERPFGCFALLVSDPFYRPRLNPIFEF